MSRRSRWSSIAALVVAMAAAEMSAGGRRGVFDREAWQHEVSRLGLDPAVVVYPFDATPEMVEWARRATAASGSTEPRQRLARLQIAIFEEEAFDFAYDEGSTLTAPAAFEARSGNCMSFTALFIAMSRGLGIPTSLMTVLREPNVDRDDGFVIVNRHVVAALRSGGRVETYDFYLNSTQPYASRQVVDDVRASAMYHNNFGGSALRDGDLDGAVRNLELATVLAPDWAASWINLGVARGRLGDIDGAFAAYGEALRADPGNPSALNNMSFLYSRLGRENEARIALRAASEATSSPFTLLAMADAERVRGNTREAERILRRAKRASPDEPEVFEALARLAAETGADRRSDRYQRKAEKLRSSRQPNR